MSDIIRCYCKRQAFLWDESSKYPGCGRIYVMRCVCGIEGPQAEHVWQAVEKFERMVAAIPAAWEAEERRRAPFRTESARNAA